MARIALAFLGWEYDDETKRVIAKFTDAPPIDYEDPAEHASTLSLEVEFLPRSVDQTDVEQPEQAQIDQLNTVVDQLIVDVLMGGML